MILLSVIAPNNIISHLTMKKVVAINIILSVHLKPILW